MILVGDSAGANLILALLSHMLHPHPDASIPPLDTAEPLKGALLVSPWTNFTPTAPSYSRNRLKDMVNQTVLTRWGCYYMGDAPTDEYNRPGTAGGKWWQGIETKVQDVAVTAGEDEVMFDDTHKFV